MAERAVTTMTKPLLLSNWMVSEGPEAMTSTGNVVHWRRLTVVTLTLILSKQPKTARPALASAARMVRWSHERHS